MRADGRAWAVTAGAVAAGGVAAALAPAAAQVRVRRTAQPPTDQWRHLPVAPRGTAQLGISFRPLQAAEFGLDPAAALAELLAYPFGLIRLAAYWDRLAPAPGVLAAGELDRQLDAAEQAGKQVVLCLGPVKSFGYPEYFVPPYLLAEPLPEGALITPAGHQALLDAAVSHLATLVGRYRDRTAIVAWQVEHEALDPLGLEHSWRLAEAFVRAEVAAVRAADPRRPVLLNGFLPMSVPVAASQAWRTRGQGDSLALAARLADIVGVDVYPRHAVASAGPAGLYLDGSQARRRRRLERVLADAAVAGREVMIAEGQAEPWEAVTTPPSPAGRVPASCRPQDVIGTYNRCLDWAGGPGHRLAGYLFWGAEYWLLRARQGDPSYLRAFGRVLEQA